MRLWLSFRDRHKLFRASDEVKTLCPSCGAEIATKDSDEEELIESVPRNFKEAVSKVARERGLSEQYIINNDIVMESWCEEDKEEFTTWYDSEGNELPAGTPIGYIVYDENNEAGFLQPYKMRQCYNFKIKYISDCSSNHLSKFVIKNICNLS